MVLTMRNFTATTNLLLCIVLFLFFSCNCGDGQVQTDSPKQHSTHTTSHPHTNHGNHGGHHRTHHHEQKSSSAAEVDPSILTGSPETAATVSITEEVVSAMLSRRKYVTPILRSVVGIYQNPIPRPLFHHGKHYQSDNRTSIYGKLGRPYNQTETQKKLQKHSNQLSQQLYMHELSPWEYYKTVSNTILMTVISFVSTEDTIHYKLYLKNFLCFIKSYNMKLLVYIVHPNLDDIQSDINELQLMGAIIINYPTELFFTLIKEKTTSLKKGRNHADYSTNYPSFRSHGALVMLVPILEVLAFEYNVIFMDVDIGLVMDPIPYLLHSNVDIVVSQESRKCQEFYSTSFPDFFHFHTLEPNSGIMFLRSNKRNTATFYQWLHLIVEDNVMNDQKVFDRRKLHLHYVHNCLQSNNEGRTATSHSGGGGKGVGGPASTIEGSHYNTFPTFCFLNEILFQNGLIGIQCPSKRAFRDDWLLEMYQYGIDMNDSYRFPVAIHANYCNGKSKELAYRGLWLLSDDDVHGGINTTTCKSYDRYKTHYTTIDWKQEITTIQMNRQSNYDSIIQRNGSIIVKAMSSPAVYYLDEQLERHLIANKSVFVQYFGENWGLVTTIPFSVMMNLTLGEPLDVIPSVVHQNLRISR